MAEDQKAKTPQDLTEDQVRAVRIIHAKHPDWSSAKIGRLFGMGPTGASQIWRYKVRADVVQEQG